MRADELAVCADPDVAGESVAAGRAADDDHDEDEQKGEQQQAAEDTLKEETTLSTLDINVRKKKQNFSGLETSTRRTYAEECKVC